MIDKVKVSASNQIAEIAKIAKIASFTFSLNSALIEYKLKTKN